MSMPRRPARPVSWVYSAGVTSAWRLAVELHELLEDDGARRHVDAEGERLGREDRADPPGGEELLDDLAEGRQHPGVVGGEAAGQALDEVPVAEHAEVLVGQARTRAPRRCAGSARPRPSGISAHVVAQQLPHRGLAADPAEDEGDRRQQPLALEPCDDLRRGVAPPPGRPAPPPAPPRAMPRPPGPPPGPRGPRPRALPRAASRVRAVPAAPESPPPAALLRVRIACEQLGVHARGVRCR